MVEKQLTDKEFVKEMQIYWQNIDKIFRDKWLNSMNDYFEIGKGNLNKRTSKIVSKLQETIIN